MTSHAQVAQVLRTALSHAGLSQAELRAQAGISQRTLTNVLSGREDFKLSTLLALCDRLGLELVLVPREAAAGAAPGPAVRPPVVRSRVQGALARIQRQGAPSEPAAAAPRAKGKRE
ncbi:helix-turn-helix domain-containing protein [Bordetella genomosp. 9]|uniref:HTH cro/C1-type domain-containing protein n=1 Tax=Bordetella genomosp. 9 TaxID=1416803 RepID=A0A1W6Z132_9BORD|nr:helix-turn-helix transcriptional regulator [Bordetella genomosp. 9]ARP86819.1 hypothetical protein CAL13_11835 [Bordetella genomosp. 9]